MRDWTLFEYPPDMIHLAVNLAHEYGFPRELTEAELGGARFFGFGPHVVFWIEPIPEMPEDFAVHLAVDPEVRSRWPVLRWQAAMREIARDMGAMRVRALVKPPVDGYLDRLGWEQRDIGHVLDILYPRR